MCVCVRERGRERGGGCRDIESKLHMRSLIYHEERGATEAVPVIKEGTLHNRQTRLKVICLYPWDSFLKGGVMTVDAPITH